MTLQGEPVTRLRLMPMLAVGLIALLGGCASRPINPPITQADPSAGYRYEVRQSRSTDSGREAMVFLAFSGGGTRAAAFSYGVLEFLGRTKIVDSKGRSVRLLDEVDLCVRQPELSGQQRGGRGDALRVLEGLVVAELARQGQAAEAAQHRERASRLQ